jgi:hypothetical protein
LAAAGQRLWQRLAEQAFITMATRQYRLDEFRQDPPPSKQPVELLCEDHNGTYALPFPCLWVESGWRNSITGAAVDASVIGWRGWND